MNTDNTITITDDQALAIVDALLEYECVRQDDRIERVLAREDGATSLRALAPLVDRWLQLRAPLTDDAAGPAIVAAFPEYNGWTAGWEYPGYLALYRDGYPTVFATPDHNEYGLIAVDVITDPEEDTRESRPNIAWPLAGRTVEGYLAAIRPVLDSLKPTQAAQEEEDNSPSCDPDEIFERVMRAMQAAEEIGGPEGAQYISLMQRIAHETEGRARRYRERYTCSACGTFDAGSQVDPDGRCVDCRDPARRRTWRVSFRMVPTKYSVMDHLTVIASSREEASDAASKMLSASAIIADVECIGGAL